ncbi:MAG TPA: glutathione S-transferase family protein [Steroidobacteraceae bacterium]|nr:glutathione S-transferase family protein [Steroidobacteraceae bacterium]
MLELYHWEPNLQFLKPLVALREAHVQYSGHYFDPTSLEQFSPSFPQDTESCLQLEREGPLLIDGVTILSSPFFILEYIAEAFPAAQLYPGGAYPNYRVRAWGQYTALQLAPGVCALGCARYLAPALAAREPGVLRTRIERIEPLERRQAWLAVMDGSLGEARLEAIRQRLHAVVRRYEATLSERSWLAGDSYSIADIDAFAMLAPLPQLAPDVVSEQATPAIMQYLQRVRARPAVREALASGRTARPEEAFVPGPEAARWG